jgi:hypothetical protein
MRETPFSVMNGIGHEFEGQVAAYLAKRYTACMQTGWERQFSGLDKYLKFDRSEVGLFLHHFPDGLLVDKSSRVFFWEAKASINIEKHAFLEYQRFIPKHLLMFCRDRGGVVYQQYLDNIRFRNSSEVVGEFPNPHPIDSDGWICPVRGHSGSGRPYREIDLSSMIAIPDFDAA